MGFAIGEEDSESVEKHRSAGILAFWALSEIPQSTIFVNFRDFCKFAKYKKNVGNLKSVAKTMDLRFLSKSGGRWISVEFLENPPLGQRSSILAKYPRYGIGKILVGRPLEGMTIS